MVQPLPYDPALEFAKEFDRRMRRAIVAEECSIPEDFAVIQKLGEITIDPDGTRRFFWRGEEKFHMRIDVNWREDHL